MIWVLIVIILIVAITVAAEQSARLNVRSRPERKSAMSEPLLLKESDSHNERRPAISMRGHKKMGAGFQIAVRASTVDVSSPFVGHFIFNNRDTEARRVDDHWAIRVVLDWDCFERSRQW